MSEMGVLYARWVTKQQTDQKVSEYKSKYFLRESWTSTPSPNVLRANEEGRASRYVGAALWWNHHVHHWVHTQV